MDDNKIKLLIEIAQMYYEQNMTQDDISKKLGIYRTTISRYLNTARQEGIINFSVNYHLCETFLLEKNLKEQFNLKHVIVVNEKSDDDTETKLNLMGKAASLYLKSIIKNGDIIGLSWGSALASMVEQLEEISQPHNLLFIPMVGGPAGKLDSRYHVNTLVYRIASKFKANSLLMDFPAILDELFLRDAIMKSQHYNQISVYWDKLSIAIFGIGSFEISDTSIWYEFYGNKDQIRPLQDAHIAGDICSRFFNNQGHPIQTTISDHIINTSLDNLKKAKHRIAIAQSPEKVDAIIAAMKGHYLNTLVTTKETAELILTRTLSPD